MVTVFFVQHGVAELKEVDASRPLAKTGIVETRKVAAHLARHGIVIREILHSGKARARQTAEIFAELLEVSEVSEHEGMNPNDDPTRLIETISLDGAMYIGHLPHMQRVVSTLVGNDENSALIAFVNSAVACVEIDNGNSHLKWFLPPALCDQ